MNKIVKEAIRKIKELEENTPCGKHIITGDVRKLSSKLFSQIEEKSIEKNHYNESTYDIFYHWLKDYVRGWGDCDDFCTYPYRK